MNHEMMNPITTPIIILNSEKPRIIIDLDLLNASYSVETIFSTSQKRCKFSLMKISLWGC